MYKRLELDLIVQALDSAHPWHAGITMGRLEHEPVIPLVLPRNTAGEFLPFSDATWFRTPSGRGEFYSDALLAQGLDALPGYVASPERGGEAAPLQLLARKADHWMNSTFANVPRHRAMEADRIGLGLLEMHPEDAAARSIAEGDEVTVTNERGSVRLIARSTGRVAQGTVAATLGWNKLAADGAGVNVLTSERLTDLGGGATFYAVNVEVSRVAERLVAAKGAETVLV